MFTAKPTRRNFPRVHRLLRGLAFEAEVRDVAEADRDPEYVEAGWREAFVVVSLGGNRSELYAIVKPGEKLDPTTLVVESWVGAFDVVMRPEDALALGASEALRRTRKVNEADATWLDWPRQMFDFLGERRGDAYQALRDDLLALGERRRKTRRAR
jgi:hypothetical protein